MYLNVNCVLYLLKAFLVLFYFSNCFVYFPNGLGVHNPRWDILYSFVAQVYKLPNSVQPPLTATSLQRPLFWSGRTLHTLSLILSYFNISKPFSLIAIHTLLTILTLVTILTLINCNLDY